MLWQQWKGADLNYYYLWGADADYLGKFCLHCFLFAVRDSAWDYR